MSMDIGGYLLLKVGDRINVDVRNLEVKIKCEYREFYIMVYSDIIFGYGGLLFGMNGRVMFFLLGGIDSLVVIWMVVKRGMEVEVVYFYSYLFISERL